MGDWLGPPRSGKECWNCEGAGCEICFPPTCGCSPDQISDGECPHRTEDGVVLTIKTIKMHDTGIGREAGYADDEALMRAAHDERMALPAEVRRMLDAVDRRVEAAFLYGTRPDGTPNEPPEDDIPF